MKLEGKVSTIIFKNETNFWTVLLVKAKKEYITAVGITDSDIAVDDELEFEGENTAHKVYGTQFKFSTYKKILPKTNKALVEYIATNVKGIGKKTASNIVDVFKDDTVNVIRYNKEKLNGIKGLNDEKIIKLNEFFCEEWEKWNVIDYLSSFNISVVIASNIYKILRGDTIKIVNENPYSLIKFVKTLDFEFVDKIAKKIGIPSDSNNRIDAGIIYALSQITEFGHTCIEREILIPYAANILEVSEEQINDGIIRLNIEKKIYMQIIDEKEFVFRSSYYLAEKNIANSVISHTCVYIKPKKYNKEIQKTSQKNSLVLSKEQEEAISTCLNNAISIVTGGPRYR